MFLFIIWAMRRLLTFILKFPDLYFRFDLVWLIYCSLSIFYWFLISLLVYFILPYLRINLSSVHPSKICHSLRSLWDWKAFQSWFDMIWLNYCALCILYWLSPCLLVYFISRSYRPSVRLSSVSWSVGGSSYTGRW